MSSQVFRSETLNISVFGGKTSLRFRLFGDHEGGSGESRGKHLQVIDATQNASEFNRNGPQVGQGGNTGTKKLEAF